MKVENLPIKKLIPYANNAKLHSDEQVKQLASSIKEFGFNNPVLIDSNNGIIAGHGRVLAAELLSLKEVPCIRLAHLSEAQRKAYIIADNRLSELGGGWNYEMLKIEIDTLKELDFDINSTGFDVGDLSQIGNDIIEGKTDPDEIPETPKKTNSEFQKIYKCGRHRIMCGDSTEEQSFTDVLNKNQKFTLLFTDPPYGVSIGKKNVFLNSFNKAGRNLNDIESDDLKPSELKTMLLKVFKNVKNFMSEDCSIFVCSAPGGSIGLMMLEMMNDCALTVRHILNWVKNQATFSMGRLDYDYQHEPIFFTWGKKHKKIMSGNFKTSVWSVDKPRACKEHPTMKPVELPENAILNHTDSSDIVFDCFAGSGTTLIAAEKTGRTFYGIELCPEYVDVIRKRWAEFVHGKECDWQSLTPEIK